MLSYEELVEAYQDVLTRLDFQMYETTGDLTIRRPLGIINTNVVWGRVLVYKEELAWLAEIRESVEDSE